MARPRREIPPVDAPETPAALAAAGGLDLESAARFLGGVSTRHVERLIEAGTLPSYRMGRRRMVPVRALQLLIQSAIEREATP